MKKALALILVAVALSGCATAQQRTAQRAATDDATCKSFGAKPGTDAYVACRMQQQSRRDARDADVGRGLQDAGRALQNIDRQQGFDCTTTQSGVFTNTHCN